MPNNEAYFKNIYAIRADLQKLDDNYWDHYEEWTPEEHASYEAKRKEMQDALEAAFNA